MNGLVEQHSGEATLFDCLGGKLQRGISDSGKGRPFGFLMSGTDDLGEQTCHYTWVAAVGANSFFRKKIQVKTNGNHPMEEKKVKKKKAGARAKVLHSQVALVVKNLPADTYRYK